MTLALQLFSILAFKLFFALPNLFLAFLRRCFLLGALFLSSLLFEMNALFFLFSSQLCFFFFAFFFYAFFFFAFCFSLCASFFFALRCLERQAGFLCLLRFNCSFRAFLFRFDSLDLLSQFLRFFL